MNSCAVSRPPVVPQAIRLPVRASADSVSTAAWVLDSLAPAEERILTYGQKTEVSVLLKASGTFDYAITLKAGTQTFRPFLTRVVAGYGQTSLRVRVSWFIKPRGKEEEVSVGLYRVDSSRTGRTKTLTLLKQISRSYDVVCDQKKCWLIRFLRAHVICSCKVASE